MSDETHTSQQETVPVVVSTLGASAVAHTEVGSGNQARGARAVRLHNGERIVGRNRYVTPDPSVLEGVMREGRVHYIPATETGGSPFRDAYYTDIFDPLCAELRERFRGRNVALRAIATSVNGLLEGAMSIDGRAVDILDIADVVERGNEQGTPSFNVQRLPADDDIRDVAAGLKYIADYTQAVASTVRYEVDNPEYKAAIFPAVLVYDADALVSTGEDRFTVRFRDGVDPSQAVLAAYVLDRTTIGQ